MNIPPHMKMYLGSMYRADVLKEGDYGQARDLLVARLKADQDMKSSAETLVKELTPVVKAKSSVSHVEKKTLGYLEDVLKEVHNG